MYINKKRSRLFLLSLIIEKNMRHFENSVTINCIWTPKFKNCEENFNLAREYAR